MPPLPAPGRTFVPFLAVCLTYYLGGRIGLSVPFVGSHISLIWPPTGIALAALLRWGPGLWPAVWLGAFGVNLAIGSSPALAFGIACGNTLGPWLAAWVLRRGGFEPGLPRRSDLVRYLAVGVLGGMAINATNGVAQLWLAGIVPAPAVVEAWTVWWLGDAMGALVVGIPLLTADRRQMRAVFGSARGGELGLALVLTFALGGVVFLGHAAEALASPLLYLPFLMLCWLAIRGGTGIAAFAALLLSAQAVWATAHGAGPFQAGDIHASLAMLWGYMATATIITVLITVLVGELQGSERRFRQMFETNQAVKLIIDPADGRIEDANRAACEFYGYPREQLLKLSMADINTLPAQAVQAEMARARAEKRLCFDFRHRLASGEIRDVEVHTGPVDTVRGPRLYSIIHDVTARKEFEAELQTFKFFSDNSSDAYILLDEDARIRYVNRMACESLGYSEAELLGMSIPEIDPTHDHERVRAHFEQCKQGRMPPFETVHRRKDGTIVAVEVISTALRVRGEWLAFTASRDISARKFAESQMRLAANVFTYAHEGITICDARQQIVDVNPRFSEITGYARAEVIGRTPKFLRSGLQAPDFYRAMWQAIERDGFWEGELWNLRKDGTGYAEHLSISSVRDESGCVTHYIGTFSDITLLKQQQARLEHLAHHDALTGLPNRTLLADRMIQALAQARRTGGAVAVCCLDLDGFKAVNDELGHAAGDTVARLGGDEFVLLLVGVEGAAECGRAATRVLQAIAAPVRIEGRQCSVSGSIGIALFAGDDDDPYVLLRHADQAMYAAKDAGKNCYRLYRGAAERHQVAPAADAPHRPPAA